MVGERSYHSYLLPSRQRPPPRFSHEWQAQWLSLQQKNFPLPTPAPSRFHIVVGECSHLLCVTERIQALACSLQGLRPD